MDTTAIEVNSLCKVFKKYQGNTVSILNGKGFISSFTALNNVTFDVRRGSSLGIIGGNGAGKSTLLKILSQIIKPTSGSALLRGKVNSLLEVGTGFLPDLSGRENIYLNGSILGMSKQEINSVYDEIVNFSGVKDFIDMPVKHYSSGMHSRLAFSIAANVTGDILLIDEILSVGDAEFRKKCLNKMNGLMTDEMRTILFVSHSMDSVRRFCDQCLWLDKGKINSFGTTDKVISEYLNASSSSPRIISIPADKGVDVDEIDVKTNSDNRFQGITTQAPESSIPAVKVIDIKAKGIGGYGHIFGREERITFEFFYERFDNAFPIYPWFHLHCLPRAGVPEEVHVLTTHGHLISSKPGPYKICVSLPEKLLISGEYSISFTLATQSKPLIRHCKLDHIFNFRILDDPKSTDLVVSEKISGVIQPDLEWSINIDEDN